MRCASYRRHLSRQLDDRTVDDAELFEHRDACAACRRWHGLVVGARRALAAAPADDVPVDLAERVSSAILGGDAWRSEQISFVDRFVRVGRVGLIAAAAAAAAMIVLAGSSGREPDDGSVDLAGEGVDPAAALIGDGSDRQGDRP